MVAYSFKRRFVEPIKVGLGVIIGARPKRQTIRADRRRHARPGEELQLYCGMRTKGCFLIGRSKCTAVRAVHLLFDARAVAIDERLVRDVDGFACADGFRHFEEMQAFWQAEHGVSEFRGVLIEWEPL